MSPMTASAARPALREPGRVPAGTGLRLITGRPVLVRSNAAFAVLCVGLLLAGLAALLLLNIALARGAYTLHALQSTVGELTDRRDGLRQELAQTGSISSLADRAVALGMVPADTAAFLRLSDGAVLGVAAPATGAEPFSVITAVQPPPAAPKKPAKAQARQPGASQTGRVSSDAREKAGDDPGAEAETTG